MERLLSLPHGRGLRSGDRMLERAGHTVSQSHNCQTMAIMGHPSTGMLIFGLGAIGAISTGSTDHYFAPFGGSSSVTTTLANAQVAVPRAITVKNLHCWVVACPSTSATFEVFQNGVFPTGGLTKTIPSVCMPNTDYSDTTNMMSFMPGDTIELDENQSSSPTGPTVASCTVEHD